MKRVSNSMKVSLALLVVLALVLSMSFSALAADDLVYDNYNRTDLSKFADSGSNAAWTGGDAGKSAAIEDNALKLDYASNGWFGTGGAIDASSYKYLVIRVKGAKGGEGADFDLNYAVGDQVKQTGKAFSDLLTATDKKIPAITTSYQDIKIDLAANSIDKGIQAFHFNFHDGASGTLYIDSISFTNGGASDAATDSKASSDSNASDNGAATAEQNPKTGDNTNLTLYTMLAVLSGGMLITLAIMNRKAKRN